MTRLKTDWIRGMDETAASWSRQLKENIGYDYCDLAARIAGIEPAVIHEAAKTTKVAVVPITCGQGVISTFGECVASIVRAMGFEAFTTKATDVNGIYEATLQGADIIYMADEDRYIALNIRNGKVGDNNIATASGFAEVLCTKAGGVAGKEVLVLGYGIIGQLMAAYLQKAGGKVTVFDKNPAKKADVLQAGHAWTDDPADIRRFRYIADGTNEGPWLTEDMIQEDACLAAPGIPLSVDDELKEKMGGRCVHDLLEIGTAVMLGLAI